MSYYWFTGLIPVSNRNQHSDSEYSSNSPRSSLSFTKPSPRGKPAPRNNSEYSNDSPRWPISFTKPSPRGCSDSEYSSDSLRSRICFTKPSPRGKHTPRSDSEYSSDSPRLSLSFTKTPPRGKRTLRSDSPRLSLSFTKTPPRGKHALRSDSPRLSLSFTKTPPRGKRALLCGVTYKKEKFRLKGTLHDVHSMRDLLLRKFNFSDDSILILAEKEAYKPPTRTNILEAFRWLMADLKSGDSLVFYFSGYGLRQPDFSDDEQDGFDETICPLDFSTEGMISDNAINDILVKPLIPGVTLHAFVDASHSGTVLDLPWVYKENKWDDNRPPSGADKGTSGGRAISFSACKDDQLAAYTSVLFFPSFNQVFVRLIYISSLPNYHSMNIMQAFSDKNIMTGAMTFLFIRAIWENPNITYQGLLDYMHKPLGKVNKVRSPLLKLLQRKIDQVFHNLNFLGRYTIMHPENINFRHMSKKWKNLCYIPRANIQNVFSAAV
ncbi:metacaspase-1 isoform X1 [Capsicum annuum]|uniref:metacaspase-1 isoform X1 n=1 Tax=Capsicum annuum TaxID=4072 RepID=UPI001FB11E47|nr:metacaspase-1 isoform X1 [Capsicum annuum]